MRPNWKEVPRDGIRGQWSKLYVTLNTKGEIVMSRITWEKMNSPKAFVVLFDTVNNRIGLKPAALTTRNAFPVGTRGRFGGRRMNVYRLMTEFRISLPSTIEFVDVETDQDGYLILDLRTARISERARNWGKNTKRLTTVGGEAGSGTVTTGLSNLQN